VDLLEERVFVLYAARKALATQMAAFDLRHVEPTPVLGSRMDLSCIGDSFRLRRIKGFIQRGRIVGIPIIKHQYLRQLRKTEGGLRDVNTAQAGDPVENLA
jgi:hypothetical protein